MVSSLTFFNPLIFVHGVRCVLTRFIRVQLCDPVAYHPLGSSCLQARILECVAMPFSRGSSNPGIKPRSSALQMDSLLSEPPGKVGAVIGSQLAVPW